ncbi:MAG: UDP-N-acetylglucosamine 2-epimerase (non-hydrolyzing) [Clostridia bacterium]|nr:UDP-N-acetylglucosamine 2-epimerase (non-hydrolyzing) [Clostridia bacterium]
MTKKIKVMTVFGTRPEAIKMAPLIKELEKSPHIESIVCLTGQHREMLMQVLETFDIKPDYNLDIMRPGQTVTTITTDVLLGMQEVLAKLTPDLLLVHGDTSTTFAGALAAFYGNVRIGHVEAGLRTYDKYSPFPEEMNRQMTSRLADLHFAPTKANKQNLLIENIKDNVYITGNTVIDALKTTVRPDYEFVDENLAKIDFSDAKYILLTAHRRENLGKPLEQICTAVKQIVEQNPDVKVIYPMHLNPKVRDTAKAILGDLDNVSLIDPIDVCDMHNLMNKCYLVMTDSGGLQEEAPALGKPVLVLRTETERPEAVDAGTVKIAGVETDTIVKMANELIRDESAYNKQSKAVNPYGDGNASQRTVQAILSYFNLGEKPKDFGE